MGTRHDVAAAAACIDTGLGELAHSHAIPGQCVGPAPSRVDIEGGDDGLKQVIDVDRTDLLRSRADNRDQSAAACPGQDLIDALGGSSPVHLGQPQDAICEPAVADDLLRLQLRFAIGAGAPLPPAK